MGLVLDKRQNHQQVQHGPVTRYNWCWDAALRNVLCAAQSMPQDSPFLLGGMAST